MKCEEKSFWTFTGLVGAFLDLGIAYFLLCASAIAFLASKFLALFGLSLPCPYDGLFGIPNNSHCFQRILIHDASEKISSVQFSVKEKFPFDSMWEKGDPIYSNYNSRSESESKIQEGEEASSSCSSIKMSWSSNKEGKFDFTGKGISKQKLRHNSLRRRHKGSSSNDILHLNQGNPFALNSGDSVDEAKCLEKEALLSAGESSDNIEIPGFKSNERNTARIIEQALEGEHSAQAALYAELEKERSAAASAADEAMAMILRLQEEKASIEMEARQYHRIIEEKTAYDEEEMNILKEMLMRRERELHFLEKKVEAYRQMFLGNYQVDDMEVGPTPEQRTVFSTSLHSIEGEHSSTLKGKTVKDVTTSSEKWVLDFGEELMIPQVEDEINEETSRLIEEQEESNLISNSILVFEESKIILPCTSYNGIEKKHDNKDEDLKDELNSMIDMSYPARDVHVIDNNEAIIKSSSEEQLRDSKRCHSPSLSGSHITRSRSVEIDGSLPPVAHQSRGRTLCSDMRRNSLPPFDYERSKIGSEVEWLRERLRAVQEEREKLNFSVGPKEKEKKQVQLLEDIASQLREIQQLTERGRAVRQASMLPPISRVSSKKRRWQCASLNVHRSPP